ncbi:MAG: hypothetical protein DI549_18415 [Ancylobacter novellus]|uniref:Uncharacterized protein n=1 Tax=Ancylobacter novellus TaxID=921 RepID=A0A2W5QYL6_ANCNO|nr:MAG: hypothetical protein DI549_18415 [Ancylobacter novellus]
MPVFDAGRSRGRVELDKPSEYPVSFRPARDAGAPIPEPARTGRAPSASERQAAGEPAPLAQEFDSGRLPAFLRETAETIAALFETVNRSTPSPARIDIAAPGRLVGPEVTARARQVLALVSYRAGHLWRDLIDATVFGVAMRDIGTRHGGNANDSAKLGREKVRDGLLFARAALEDLQSWGRTQERAVQRDIALPAIGCRALGYGADVPANWHEAANDNVRRLAA